MLLLYCRLSGRVPVQLRQIETGVLRPFDCRVERGKAEPPNHVFPSITARDSIAPAMARQRIIDIFVHTSRAQRVFEAMPERMKDAALVFDAEFVFVTTEPFRERFAKATF